MRILIGLKGLTIHPSAPERRAMQERVPLIYLHGVSPSWLRDGLQGFEGGRLLVLPHRKVDMPTVHFLAERYEVFRRTG